MFVDIFAYLLSMFSIQFFYLMFMTVKALFLLLSLLNFSSPLEEAGYRKFRPEIEDSIGSVVTIFADNLSNSEKEIRISTLKILCHYKFLDSGIPSTEQMAEKRRKTESSYISNVDSTPSNVCILYSELLSFLLQLLVNSALILVI